MSEETLAREVYVGSGKSIVVTPSTTGKVLDYKKVLKILKENPAKEYYLGIREDWFFTGTSLADMRGKPLDQWNTVNYSDWGTPILRDENDEEIEVFTENNNEAYQVCYASGRKSASFSLFCSIGHSLVDVGNLSKETRDQIKELIQLELDKK